MAALRKGLCGFAPKLAFISEMLEVTILLATTCGSSPDFGCKVGLRLQN